MTTIPAHRAPACVPTPADSTTTGQPATPPAPAKTTTKAPAAPPAEKTED